LIPDAPAPAADPTPPPAIVVTASRTGLGSVPEATLVDRAEIERRQPVTLLEMLDGVAGVRAVSTGGVGGGSFLTVEGGEPNFTLVLIEGMKLNNPTNSRGGAFDLSQIDPAAVEAVEVARGPLSAVHGADALAGVVTVRLREPPADGLGYAARLTADSRGATDAALTLGRGWGSGGLLGSASRFDSGGLDLGSDLRRTQGLVRLRQSAGRADISILGLWADTRRATFPEDSGGPRLAVNRAREQASETLRAIGSRVGADAGGGWRPEIEASWSEQGADTDTPAIAPGALPGVPAIESRDRFRRFEATATLGYERTGLSAVAGGSVLRETGRSDGTLDLGFPLPVIFAAARTTLSGFAEATLRPLPALTLNLAGRRDAVEGGVAHWTGRGGLSFRPFASGLAFFARAGNGYKLPSFYALGHPLIGNPALRPERSRRLELGAASEGRRHSFRLAWFENRFRDLIDFDPVLFRTVNRDRVRARGIEAEGHIDLDRHFTVSGALTRLSLRSATPLRGRPAWQGSAEALWRVGAVELDGRIRFNGDYFDSSIPTGLVRRGGRVVGELGLRWRLARTLSLRAVLLNVGNERTGEAIGFPASGRTLRVTLEAARF
jgi:vitamin B12 transporter